MICVRRRVRRPRQKSQKPLSFAAIANDRFAGSILVLQISQVVIDRVGDQRVGGRRSERTVNQFVVEFDGTLDGNFLILGFQRRSTMFVIEPEIGTLRAGFSAPVDRNAITDADPLGILHKSIPFR